MAAAAIGALAAGAVGGQLAGGTLDVLRNVAGFVGIGLVCAAAVGGDLAWVGPTAYLLAGVYALYTQWPPHDLGAAIRAGVVFACGLVVTTVRGARDTPGE